ncbi:MAG: hypothetical protein KAV42_01170 [Candidatus Krumholzibacteria bacterium]|nr:hypothetical protein [Candidatus Krumholzibacteria bacterium]
MLDQKTIKKLIAATGVPIESDEKDNRDPGDSETHVSRMITTCTALASRAYPKLID